MSREVELSQYFTHDWVAHELVERYFPRETAFGERSTWAAVVRAALEALGGSATLAEIYREIEGHRPTPNRFLQAKARQCLQLIAIRTGRGMWTLPSMPYEAAQAA